MTAAGVRAWLHENRRPVRRGITAAFVCVIAALLVRVGLTIEWGKVAQAVLDTPNSSLGIAAVLVLVSYGVYSCFDLLGKWYTGHELPYWRIMMAAFISYAFTMNFGSAVGGVALRLRLYAKQGLDPGQIVRIMGLSMATNWIGYSLLGGAIFATGAVQLPSEWGIGTGFLRALGVVMVVVAIGYVALCGFSARRSWTIRDHVIELPEWRLAVSQLGLAMTNWALMGAIVHMVMPGDVGYATVLGTLLIGSIAGSIAHIPGGLGVTEYVFITLLSPPIPQYQVLGAILVYRVLYYVGPVLLAGACYLIFEARSPAGVSRGTRIA